MKRKTWFYYLKPKYFCIVVFFIVMILSCTKDDSNPVTQDSSDINPLTQWQFKDATYYYASGLMDLKSSSDSLTLFLTNQEITCSDIPLMPYFIGGAWIEVMFPDLTIREYSWQECGVHMHSYDGLEPGYISEGIEAAEITSIDTVENRIKGWVEFDGHAGYTATFYGSFDVPYCTSL
jgi:hypothetical protein